MKKCPICIITKKACKKLGNESYCDSLIKDLYANKITAEQVIEKLQEKFGDKVFKEIGKEASEKNGKNG